MRRVWKWQLDHRLGIDYSVLMPIGSEIIATAVQNDLPTVWYLCDPDVEKEWRNFALVGTGNDVPDGYQHIGSFLLYSDALVLHLFEK